MSRRGSDSCNRSSRPETGARRRPRLGYWRRGRARGRAPARGRNPRDRRRHVRVAAARRACVPRLARRAACAAAAGRAFVDWETLFDAAADADWPLVVVCSNADLLRIRALNADARAEVHCELDADAYARLLRGASVIAIPMHEREISQGHIRLMEA